MIRVLPFACARLHSRLLISSCPPFQTPFLPCWSSLSPMLVVPFSHASRPFLPCWSSLSPSRPSLPLRLPASQLSPFPPCTSSHDQTHSSRPPLRSRPIPPLLPSSHTAPPPRQRARGHRYYNSGVGVQLSPPPHPPADFPSSHVSLPLHPLPSLMQSLSHVALGPFPAAARLWPSLSQRCSCAAITTAPPTGFPPMSPCPCTLSHPSCNHSHTSRMAPPPRQLGEREAIAITTVATARIESAELVIETAREALALDKRASACVVSALAPTARKRPRANGTGDVRGVEGAGVEIGVGGGGRAASGAASVAENKGAEADEVGTAGEGQRANDARTAQAGGAEKRTVRDAKDAGKVERLRLAGVFQLESGEWVAQATIRGQQ
ncbi:unnamed protein product [Closterium sp. NIES-64]|nr:unnamed protein product [Closterium sp. NIES-64]